MIGIEGMPVAPDDFRGTRAVEDRIDDGPLEVVLTGQLRRLKDWYVRDAAFHKEWWAAVLDYRERCKAAATMVALDKIEAEAKAFVNITEHPPVWDQVSNAMSDVRRRVGLVEARLRKQVLARAEAKRQQEHILRHEADIAAKRRREIRIDTFLNEQHLGIVRGTASYAFAGLAPREQVHIAKVVELGASPAGLSPRATQFAEEYLLLKESA